MFSILFKIVAFYFLFKLFRSIIGSFALAKSYQTAKKKANSNKEGEAKGSAGSVVDAEYRIIKDD